ncbi:MAG: hypothetical protein Q7R91_01485 [bacterium]|nr:hypothetical protein [bacterium]
MEKHEKERCRRAQQKGWPIPTLRRCLLDVGHSGDHDFPKAPKLPLSKAVGISVIKVK